MGAGDPRPPSVVVVVVVIIIIPIILVIILGDAIQQSVHLTCPALISITSLLFVHLSLNQSLSLRFRELLRGLLGVIRVICGATIGAAIALPHKLVVAIDTNAVTAWAGGEGQVCLIKLCHTERAIELVIGHGSFVWFVFKLERGLCEAIMW